MSATAITARRASLQELALVRFGGQWRQRVSESFQIETGPPALTIAICSGTVTSLVGLDALAFHNFGRFLAAVTAGAIR